MMRVKPRYHVRPLLLVITLATFLAGTSALYAQQAADRAAHILFTQSSRQAKGSDLNLLSTSRAIALDLDLQKFRQVAGSTLRIADLPLSPGLRVDVSLHERNLIEPGATLTMMTAEGPAPLPPHTVKLYRGHVEGDENSDVYLAVSNSSVIGNITFDGKEYELGTDFDTPSRNNVLSVISYPTDLLENQSINCGLNKENLDQFTSDEYRERIAKEMEPRILSGAAEEVLYSVKGAWDADVEYYARLFSSDIAKAQDYMISLIGQVSAVYERDLQCQLTIEYMNIWTVAGNGYPYNEGTVMSVALGESRAFWDLPAQREVDYAFAHIFSGKAWVNPIGIAFLDVLCGKGRAVCFSAITRTNTARDRRVVAHETGHIFGSHHTHHCGWNGPAGGAIHRCAPAEGGNCFGSTQQELGTIMSYCSQSDLRFHELVITRLKGYLADNRGGCVSFARKLSISPNLILFPETQINEPRDTTLEAFFRNEGQQAIEVTEVLRSGTRVDQFEIVEGEPPFTLEQGEEKRIIVKFKAEDEQPAILKLTFVHNGLNEPVEVTFQAFATFDRPILAFHELLRPQGEPYDIIDFGEHPIGAEADTTRQKFYLNLGTARLFASSTEIVGPNFLEFQIIDGTAPFELEEKDSIGITLRFSPFDEGEKVAYLVTRSNSEGIADHLDTVKLIGRAKTGPVMQLGIRDLIIDFGDVDKGRTYDTTFADFFANIGSEPLFYSQLVIGADADLFPISPDFGIELIPGRKDPLTALFFAGPEVPLGIKRAELIIDRDDPLGFDTVHMVANLVGPSSVPGELEGDENFSVAPNPATNNIRFWLSPLPNEIGKEYAIRIMDVNGREVYREEGVFAAEGSTYEIAAKDWASGTYFVRVTTGTGTRIRTVTLAR